MLFCVYIYFIWLSTAAENFLMKVSEVIKSIELAEEFSVCREALSMIEYAEIEDTEEYHAISEALFRNFWGLPKQKNQEEWAQLVLDAIEKRKDSREFLSHLLECIKGNWGKIDIRLKEKFILLVQRIAQRTVRISGAEIERYVTKGPEAAYDLELMRAYIESRAALTGEESSYLLKYLLDHADTYFTNFFINSVLPKFQETGVSQMLREQAYLAGNKQEVSLKMRELLYSIHKCSAE